MTSSQTNTPIYGSTISEALPGSTPQFQTSKFPGSPITMSQDYRDRIKVVEPTTRVTRTTTTQHVTESNKTSDKQFVDKLGDIFGHKEKVSYWPLLTFIIVWVVFGLVILIIFLAAGKVGWGFYYLVSIIIMGIIFALIIWTLCKEGYSTVAWVITGLFVVIALGFVIWASVAYPKIKNLGQSPFGTKS